jgi:hypothetical protein
MRLRPSLVIRQAPHRHHCERRHAEYQRPDRGISAAWSSCFVRKPRQCAADFGLTLRTAAAVSPWTFAESKTLFSYLLSVSRHCSRGSRPFSTLVFLGFGVLVRHFITTSKNSLFCILHGFLNLGWVGFRISCCCWMKKLFSLY